MAKFAYKFGIVVAYSNAVTSSTVYESRVNYGSVVGRNISGNLLVENFATKVIEPVALVNEIIEVDNIIRRYFENYDEISGIKYNKSNTIVISAVNLLENPIIPIGPWMARSTEVDMTLTLEPRRLDVCSRREMEDALYKSKNVHNHFTEVHENLDPKVVERGSLCHDSRSRGAVETDQPSNPLDFTNQRMTRPDLESIDHVVIDAMKLFELDTIYQYDGSDSEDDDEDYNLIPPTRTTEADSDSEGDGGIDIFTSVVSEIGNSINININNIDYLKLDQQQMEEIITMAVQMNRKSMEQLHPGKTKESLTKEISAVLGRDTFEGVQRNEIPAGTSVNYMMSKHTVKTKEGAFDRVKSRTLLGGDRTKNIYKDRVSEISARTVSLSALYTVAVLTAYLDLEQGVFDFQNAFVYAKLPESEQCYARMPKEESQIMIEVDPEVWTKYLNEDGHIYVRMKGALYGHPLSPMLWYQFMKEKLELLGFKTLGCEPCIFIRTNPTTNTLDIIAVHVDDLLIGTKCAATWDEIRSFRDKYFSGEGTLRTSDTVEYCNINFSTNRGDKSVYISQDSYWNKLVEKFKVLPGSTKDTPYKSNYMERLRQRPNDTEGDEETKTEFLSVIMSIFWGAKRSKPESLFTVSSLATQSKFGTKEDYDDAMIVMEYTSENKPQGTRLCVNGNLRIHCFVDSSGSIHKDTRGHGGWVFGFGDKGYGGPIEAHAGKAKQNGRSVLEYELYSLNEALPSGLFLFNLLEELGFPQQPIIIFEDNFGTIELIKRGPISTGVTKHIAAKYYFSRDLIRRHIICFRHCPSYLMIADILTKTLTKADFKKMAARLRNDYQQDPSLSDDVYERLFANSNDKVYNDQEEEKAVQLIIRIIDSLVGHP